MHFQQAPPPTGGDAQHMRLQMSRPPGRCCHALVQLVVVQVCAKDAKKRQGKHVVGDSSSTQDLQDSQSGEGGLPQGLHVRWVRSRMPPLRVAVQTWAPECMWITWSALAVAKCWSSFHATQHTLPAAIHRLDCVTQHTQVKFKYQASTA